MSYFRSKQISPNACCSRWWYTHKLIAHLSDGLSPMPPSLPLRTCAHSIGKRLQSGTQQ